MTSSDRQLLEREMREAFEEWARAFGFPMEPHPTTRGYYREAHTTMAWHGWQAAWTASRKAALEEAAQVAESSECGFADPWEYDRNIAAAIRDLSKGVANAAAELARGDGTNE